MKKILFFFALLLCFNISAQEVKGSFGFRAGLNAANISGEYTDYNLPLFRFHAGIVYDMQFVNNWSFQPELSLSVQGAKRKGISLSYSQMASMASLYYLNMPFMMRNHIGNGMVLEVGPQVGILLGGEEKMVIAQHDGVEEIVVDANDYLEMADFAVVVGIAYHFPKGLFYSARYNVGISNIIKQNVRNTDPRIVPLDIKRQNRVFQISLGYMF